MWACVRGASAAHCNEHIDQEDDGEQDEDKRQDPRGKGCFRGRASAVEEIAARKCAFQEPKNDCQQVNASQLVSAAFRIDDSGWRVLSPGFPLVVRVANNSVGGRL